MPTVNGHIVDTGCYVDGHWGQYAPDHLADRAEEFGWTADKPTDDPRILRVFADELDNCGYTDAAATLMEFHSETGDEIITWLNDHTPAQQYAGMALAEPGPGLVQLTQSFVWHWHEGEVFLSPICDDGECDDDTCAHWD